MCLRFFGNRLFEETPAYLSGLGVDAVELGCGGFPDEDHLNHTQYLSDRNTLANLQALPNEYRI